VNTPTASLPVLVSRLDNRTWREVFPGETVAICVRGGDVKGAYSIMEVIASPNHGVPLHLHSWEEEIFYVIDGCVRFRCGGREFDAPAGTCIAIPMGAPHAWRNFAASPARMLVTFTPGGFDELFEEIDGRSLADVDAIAQRYGTFVVGPMIDDLRTS
jgi:mannose-6-phosphate isomerase-like protein (cupin superfamily)